MAGIVIKGIHLDGTFTNEYKAGQIQSALATYGYNDIAEFIIAAAFATKPDSSKIDHEKPDGLNEKLNVVVNELINNTSANETDIEKIKNALTVNGEQITGIEVGEGLQLNVDENTKKLIIGVDYAKIGNLNPYPVGYVLITINDENPGTIFGGQWEKLPSGRMLMNVDPNDPAKAQAESLGGNKTINLTQAQLPAHSHAAGTITAASGGSHSHGNIQTGKNGGTVVFKNYNRRVTSNTDFITSTYSGVLSYFGDTSDGNTGSNVYTNSAGAHTHGTTGSTENTGTGADINIENPYITVNMWKRVA